MYQILVPVGFIGIVFYLNHQYEKYVFSKSSLHNGSFDDFYIVDTKTDL